ncbi:MAG: hypothetical protein M1819_006984 [Sarea resinae]|nr:MAG: hypothetical protein M1819_006984 [Sarea resinae]
MARSLNELMSFLLGEIALCGEQGASVADVLKFIKDFYLEDPFSETLADPDSNSPSGLAGNPPDLIPGLNRSLRQKFAALHPAESTDKPTIDHSFQVRVWAWLTAHPDVRIGKQNEGKKLTLSQAEALEEQHKTVDLTISATDVDPELAQKTSTPIEGLSPELARFEPRVYVGQERMWYAITGHNIDWNKIPRMEFLVLSVIAAHREQGVVHTDLIALTGQDKRSIPKRTDALARKGYIVKTPIITRAQRTSLCVLRKFSHKSALPSNVKLEGSSIDEETSHLTAVVGDLRGTEYLDVKNLVFGIFGQLRGNDGLITYTDLRRNLAIYDSKWHTKLCVKMVRRLELLGFVSRVRATSAHRKNFHKCIKLVHYPDEQELAPLWVASGSFSQALPLDGDEDAEGETDDEDLGEGVNSSAQEAQTSGNELQEVGRLLPQWSPYRPLPNLVFSIIDATGTEAMSTVSLKSHLMGAFFRRPLENILMRLTDNWQQSQPPHLRHLAIVRDTDLISTVTHYKYRSYENFKRLVEAGAASWEAVGVSDIKSTKKKGADIVTDAAQLDEYEFPIYPPSLFVGNDSSATLQECITAAKVETYQMPRHDPMVVELEDGRIDIDWGKLRRSSGPQGASRVPRLPRAPKDPNQPRTIGRPRKYAKGEEPYSVQGRAKARAALKQANEDKKKAREEKKEAANARARAFTESSNANLLAKTDNAEQAAGAAKSDTSAQSLTASYGSRTTEHNAVAAEAEFIPEAENAKFSQPIMQGNPVDPDINGEMPHKKPPDSSERAGFQAINKPPEQPQAGGNCLRLEELAAAGSTAVVGPASKPRGRPPKKKRKQSHPPIESNDNALDVSGNQLQERALLPTPGVYIDPPGVSKPEHKGRGRPRKSKMAVFKSTRLTEFSWFSTPVAAPDQPSLSAVGPDMTLTSTLLATPAQAVEHPRDTRLEAPSLLSLPYPQPAETDAAASIFPTPEGLDSSKQQKETSKGMWEMPRDLLFELQESSASVLQSLRGAWNRPFGKSMPRHASRPKRVREEQPKQSPARKSKKKRTMPDQGEVQIQKSSRGKKSTEPSKPKVLIGGGTIAYKRNKIVLDVVDKCGGVFPGDNEMWYPFTQAWMEMSNYSTPDRTTPMKAVKGLVDSGKLRKLKFSFKDKRGVMKTKPLLTRSDISPTSSVVREMQKKIIDADPLQYMPPEAEVPHDLRSRLDNRRTHPLPPPGFSVPIDGQNSQVRVQHLPIIRQRVQVRKRRMESDESDDDTPLPGPHQTRLEALSRVVDAQSTVPPVMFAQGSWHPRVDRLFSLQGSRQGRLILPNTGHPRPGQAGPQAFSGGSVNMQPSYARYHLNTTPRKYYQRRAPWHPYKSWQNTISTSSEWDQGQEGFILPRSSSTTFQPNGDYIFQVSGLKGFGTVSANSRLPLLTSPQQTFYPNIGTFSTDLVMPRISKKDFAIEPDVRYLSGADLQYFHERNLPNSLEDITHRRLKGRRRDHERQDNPSWSKFRADVESVARWEIQNPILIHGKSTNWRFINHTLPGEAPLFESIPALRFNAEDSFTLSHPPQANLPMDSEDEDLLPRRGRRSGRPRGKPPGTGRPPGRPPGIRRALEKPSGRPPGPRAPQPKPKTPKPRAHKPETSTRPTPQPQFKVRRLTAMLDKATSGPLQPLPQMPKYRRNRRPGLENTIPFATLQRFMVAVTVIRTVTGGLERNIDWVLVGRLFEPEYDERIIQRRWPRIMQKHRLHIEKMQVDFQEVFAQAYEDGLVPPLDYDNLESYDWAWLVDWAQSNLDVPSARSVPNLPADRQQLDSLFDLRKEELAINNWREEFFSPTVTTAKRVRTITSLPYVAPLTSEPAGGNEREETMALAKSWVRANVITDQAVYDPVKARDKLLTLGESAINDALESLLRDKILVEENKGRLVPGRNYDVSDQFLKALKTSLDEGHFNQAAAFKFKLDRVFGDDGPGSIEYDYDAEDGGALATINLLANQRIQLRPRDPPRKKTGLTDTGDYRTRLMDKSKFRFHVDIFPSTTYEFGKPVFSLPPPPPPSTEVGKNRKIPVYYDIHSRFIPQLWHLVLVAVLTRLALRPGSTAESVTMGLKPSLEVWEVGEVMEWAVGAGLARRVGVFSHGDGGGDPKGGYVVAEWWWMVFSEAAASRMVEEREKREEKEREKRTQEKGKEKDESGNMNMEETASSSSLTTTTPWVSGEVSNAGQSPAEREA